MLDYEVTPTCRTCNQPAIRRYTCSWNPNGNAGRPYFACATCQWNDRWVCWADTKGISANNPRCGCGLPCRQDRIGVEKREKKGRGFWTCILGKCEFYSESIDGTPGSSVDGFDPWLC